MGDGAVGPEVLATAGELVLAQLDLAVVVGVEDLIYAVALALAGSLAEVEGLHVERTVAEKRVAEHKHLVDTVIATRSEAGTIGGVAVVAALDGRHRGVAGLDPYKLPVVVEVVGEELTRLEGVVVEGTLGMGSYSHDHHQ